MLLDVVVKVIKEQYLLSQVKETGEYLWAGLEGVQVCILFLFYGVCKDEGKHQILS